MTSDPCRYNVMGLASCVDHVYLCFPFELTCPCVSPVPFCSSLVAHHVADQARRTAKFQKKKGFKSAATDLTGWALVAQYAGDITGESTLMAFKLQELDVRTKALANIRPAVILRPPSKVYLVAAYAQAYLSQNDMASARAVLTYQANMQQAFSMTKPRATDIEMSQLIEHEGAWACGLVNDISLEWLEQGEEASSKTLEWCDLVDEVCSAFPGTEVGLAAVAPSHTEPCEDASSAGEEQLSAGWQIGCFRALRLVYG